MTSLPKLSAYVSAFNVLQNGLPYEEPLRAMLAFFDEVVVAVNTSTDDTLATLQAFEGGALKVIPTSFSYKDVTFDGATKNAALQACTQEDATNRVYVQMDLDERVPGNQRALWRDLAGMLIRDPVSQCMMIPTLDVWGSVDTIRADKPIGVKFRMHKAGLHRGVWQQAWLNPQRTRFDTSMSDSCELLDQHGNLVRANWVVPPQYLHPSTCHLLEGFPYTVHLGYLDYAQRIRINKAIWKEHWELRSGQPENVATSIEDLTNVPLVKHGLPLS